jgi:succinoglycan biosynthesis protein ExoA
MTAVTVVMPVLNEERSVVGAVQSVLAQTFTDIELLVVDGDSTDATVALVRDLAGADTRVRVLRNPARTIPHALNVALGEARGRYLARVDGHAAVNDTYLERAVTRLESDPRVAAVGGRRIGVASSRGGVAVATALSSRFGVGDSINHYADQAQETDHASFGVFRTDVLREVGGWDEALLVNEDVDLDHRILAARHLIWFDPEMSIFWHVRESVRALARQYRRYGRGKAAMVIKNGRRAVHLRHLAPPGLVLGLAVGVLAAPFYWPVTAAAFTPYLLALALATVVTLRTALPIEEPARSGVTRSDVTPSDVTPSAGVPSDQPAARRPGPLPLAAAFAAMHLGWGLGFIEGLLLRLRPASASAELPTALRGPAAASALVEQSQTSPAPPRRGRSGDRPGTMNRSTDLHTR